MTPNSEQEFIAPGMPHASEVTICVPTYNAAATLADTLESILNQTYRNLRILVVDNLSSDRTVEIACEFAARDPRIEVILNERNLGGEGNFNRCIELSNGDYTAIYHSDDIYEPEMVAKAVAALDADDGLGAVFTAGILIDEDGRNCGDYLIPTVVLQDRDVVLNFPVALRTALQFGNIFITPSAMMRTGLWKALEGFRGDQFKTSSDLDVWLRLMQSGKSVKILRERLVRYRVSRHSYSFNLKRIRLEPHDILLVLDKHFSENRHWLGKRDVDNYRFYHFKDAVNRAINHVIMGDTRQGRALIMQNLSVSVALAALNSRVQAKLFAVGMLTLLLTFFCRNNACRAWLRQRRFG